jgi:hypothetical protein
MVMAIFFGNPDVQVICGSDRPHTLQLAIAFLRPDDYGDHHHAWHNVSMVTASYQWRGSQVHHSKPIGTGTIQQPTKIYFLQGRSLSLHSRANGDGGEAFRGR